MLLLRNHAIFSPLDNRQLSYNILNYYEKVHSNQANMEMLYNIPTFQTFHTIPSKVKKTYIYISFHSYYFSLHKSFSYQYYKFPQQCAGYYLVFKNFWH